MDGISQNKQEIQLLLSEHPSVGIILSERQTTDSTAAALSLHLAFQDSGKNSQVVSLKEPIVEQSFLVGIDQISKSFSGTIKTMTVSFPYKEGEIEKVSYNIEGDRLNVNLFAEENGISFSEKDVRYIKQGSAPTLIFTIGVNNPQELEGLVDPKGAKIVNIDNSVNNALFGDVVLVDASYSSLSEIVAKLTQELGLQVEFDVAQNMLDGIAASTNNFSSPKTSPIAFEMAGVLMSRGAVRKNVKETRPQSNDTSLQMLGKNPQSGQKPQQQKNQNRPFDSVQNKPQQQQQQNPKKYQPQQQNNNQQWNSQPTQQQQPRPQEQPRPVEQPRQNDEPRQEVRRQDVQESRPQQPQPIEEMYRPEPASMPAQPQPAQPQSFQEAPQNGVSDYQNDQSNGVVAQIPTEDEAPSDWFIPKVFKSNKSQD